MRNVGATHIMKEIIVLLSIVQMMQFNAMVWQIASKIIVCAPALKTMLMYLLEYVLMVAQVLIQVIVLVLISHSVKKLFKIWIFVWRV